MDSRPPSRTRYSVLCPGFPTRRQSPLLTRAWPHLCQKSTAEGPSAMAWPGGLEQARLAGTCFFQTGWREGALPLEQSSRLFLGFTVEYSHLFCPKSYSFSVRGKLPMQVCSCQSHVAISLLFCAGFSKVDVADTGGWEGIHWPRLEYSQNGGKKKVLFFNRSFSRYTL